MLVRLLSFGGGLLVGALVGLFVGGFLGVLGGDMNATIDFCMDDGALRYIHDDSARDQSCQ